MNTLAGIAAKVDRERQALQSFLSFFIPGIPELFRRIVVLTIDIRGLAQHTYPATRVFVTFVSLVSCCLAGPDQQPVLTLSQ